MSDNLNTLKEIDNEVKRICIDNLPKGLHFEKDGSCWECVNESGSLGWRWRPMNWKAFAKEFPEGEMTDFYPAHITN